MLDSTYGTGGVAIVPATAGADTNEFGLSVDSQGRALVAGRIGVTGSMQAAVVLR